MYLQFIVFFCDRAAKYLVRTGPVVTLEVAKQAALYHGLATMLNQPSPELSRGKGDGADLSFDEDDEFSGDDMDFMGIGAAGLSRYNMYQCNGEMRSSCSSSTLVASDSMHLLSPPRPPEDNLRRPTAFPHHLQLQLQNFHQRQQMNDTEMGQPSYASYSGKSNVMPRQVTNLKLVRQLSFPQEEDEDGQDLSLSDSTNNLHNNLPLNTTPSSSTAPINTATASCSNQMSTSSSPSPSENIANESTVNSCQSRNEIIEIDATNSSQNRIFSSTARGRDAEDTIVDLDTDENDLANTNDKVDDDDMKRKKAALVDEINHYCFMKRKATSFPQCSIQNGIAISPIAASCDDLIGLSSSTSKCKRDSLGKNSTSNSTHYKDKRSTMRATMSASVLLTNTNSISLNDVSSEKKCEEEGEGNSALRDSNYWSSNCSTRASSTLCSPTSTLSSNNAALMRASQSDSSLARWNDSFEALSRKGLSESALGVPRVVGSSRLLKFLINTYTTNNNNSQGNEDGINAGSTKTNDYYGARKSSNTFTFLPSRSKSSDAILSCEFQKRKQLFLSNVYGMNHPR